MSTARRKAPKSRFLWMVFWVLFLTSARAESPAPFAPSYKGNAKPSADLQTLKPKDIAGEGLRVWLKHLKGNLEVEKAAIVQKKVEQSIFGYPLLVTFTTNELRRQVEFERKNGTLDCILPEECLKEVARRLHVTNNAQVAVSHQENGAWRIEMKLGRFGEEQERYFVEDVPEFADVSQAVSQMLPDLIGKRSSLRDGEGVLRVTSDPLGAEVYVAGKLRGTTPVSLPGLHGTKIEISCRQGEHKAAMRGTNVQREAEIIEEFFRFHGGSRTADDRFFSRRGYSTSR